MICVDPLKLLVGEEGESSLVKMPLIRKPEVGVLSASEFAGGWVDSVGDDTGLVGASSPF